MSAESSARSVSETEKVDKVRALQRVLYRSAKQDPPGASTSSTTRSPAATSCGGHGPRWPTTKAPPASTG